MSKTPVPEEVDEVTRCRRVREELDGQFRSIDEALAFLSKIERVRPRSHPRARSARKGVRRPSGRTLAHRT